ncbi:MAG: Sec-independent protein translocase protein TatB [Gammaproteobacteria bacterium]
MFDVGFWELLLVGVVALIVFGPERLPAVAREAGLWIGKARRALAEARAEIVEEMELDDLKRIERRLRTGRADLDAKTSPPAAGAPGSDDSAGA